MSHDITRALHCFPCGFRGGGWRGGRERQPIDVVIQPAYDRVTVFSLRHACLAAGLLEDVRKGHAVSWFILGELVETKWKGSVQRFLNDAAMGGVSLHQADARASDLRGAVIGWTSAIEGTALLSSGPFGICPDVNLTLAILGRRVADVFVAARAPDYRWATLFDGAFEVDDSLGEAPALTDRPWLSFDWQLGPAIGKRTRRSPLVRP